MSRAEEAARKAYPILPDDTPIGKNVSRAFGKIYQNGYEQREKGIISLIESRIREILGDAQPAPVLRAELRELINKIKEQ